MYKYNVIQYKKVEKLLDQDGKIMVLNYDISTKEFWEMVKDIADLELKTIDRFANDRT